MKQKSIKIFVTSFILFFLSSKFIIAEGVPDIWAQSFIAIDADSGRIIVSNNANKRLPMASTTKIMTTILSIDNINNVNEKFEIPESCVGIEGSSIYLKPKQIVSFIDLLYGTMLRSGNDAALALATITGKNDAENFIDMMNAKAKELGAYNTNFVNPNGLHDDNHYTTAYDLAIISQYAMKSDLFKEISSAKKYKANSLNTILYNKNKVVHQYKYGNGIKIGYTRAAGRCLVASAEKNDTEIIVVLLNDNSWFNDSYKIFDWAFENYNNYSIVEKGQYVGSTNEGKPVFTDSNFSYLLTEEEKTQIKFKSNITTPHIINGNKTINYGTYNIYLGNDLIHTGNLISN
ncbi:D-alanyl-D-alanine carboxypeptidase family protein [Sedimentibacter sp. MB31-C6]|uniref:D-alanyl-D-alanine carboxypeptidase family protein n=1 Tax=Sedimentibacter sp. MB31-C6 TaxID=3109366 RepID=UPI002DDCAC10|nr:D-alanyl-D-alanine carboxypeptidase family protein [Sedimentibacter sp. MB36-C1]WSI04203.1 D-alanyl-D-alanine carboxypeptidase family protein [Sedimentibacter sp. MB36-C1]